MPPRAGRQSTPTYEANYKIGVANASLFYNEDMDARSFVHGDDFVTLGDDIAQARLVGQLDKRYEYKRRGVLRLWGGGTTGRSRS
eukprot:1420305-Heterocapsa_arctica.AAC.1